MEDGEEVEVEEELGEQDEELHLVEMVDKKARKVQGMFFDAEGLVE